MLTLDSTFLALIGATETRPLHLVEVMFSVPMRLSSADAVTWNGYVWASGRAVTVSEITHDGGGKIGATVTIGNDDSVMSGYLLNGELWIDRPVSIWSAWLDGSGNPHVVLSVAGYGTTSQLGSMEHVGGVVGGPSLTDAPRLLITDLIPWPPPMEENTLINWNGTDYVITGRNA
jgi:hypothetical protein